jgi:hypothetical protein
MHRSITFVLSLAVLGFTSAQGYAETKPVKLTKEQVTTVCGKKLESGGGAIGCTKPCGIGGKSTCNFGCYKGKCTGEILMVGNTPSGPKGGVVTRATLGVR